MPLLEKGIIWDDSHSQILGYGGSDAPTGAGNPQDYYGVYSDYYGSDYNLNPVLGWGSEELDNFLLGGGYTSQVYDMGTRPTTTIYDSETPDNSYDPYDWKGIDGNFGLNGVIDEIIGLFEGVGGGPSDPFFNSTRIDYPPGPTTTTTTTNTTLTTTTTVTGTGNTTVTGTSNTTTTTVTGTGNTTVTGTGNTTVTGTGNTTVTGTGTGTISTGTGTGTGTTSTGETNMAEINWADLFKNIAGTATAAAGTYATINNVAVPPDPRNLTTEGQQTLAAQLGAAPSVFNAYGQYGPQLGQNAIDLQNQAAGNIPGLAAGVNTADRTAALSDVSNLSSQYQQIMQGANQPYYNQLGVLTNAANAAPGQSASQQQAAALAAQGANVPGGNAALSGLNQQYLGNLGPSGLQQQQNAIAQQLLANGGNLSPSELRNVQQSSRVGFASRGLGATNASVVDEAMQTDAAQRQRLAQNLGLAQQVQNQGMNEQAQQNALGLAASGQNYNYGQLGLSGYQNQLSALQNAAALAEQQRLAQLTAQQNALTSTKYLDPFSNILTTGTNQNLVPSALSSAGGVQNQLSSMFNPFPAYASDVYNTNYNAQAAANNANANNQAAAGGALLKTGLSLFGA